jgi:hypothetical protein
MSDKRSALPNFGVDQACPDRQNLALYKSSSRGGTAGKAALFKNEETRPRRLYDAAGEPGTPLAGCAGATGQECRRDGRAEKNASAIFWSIFLIFARMLAFAALTRPGVVSGNSKIRASRARTRPSSLAAASSFLGIILAS